MFCLLEYKDSILGACVSSYYYKYLTALVFWPNEWYSLAVGKSEDKKKHQALFLICIIQSKWIFDNGRRKLLQLKLLHVVCQNKIQVKMVLTYSLRQK